MASRMERYYRSNNPKRRSQLNQDLYHNIYEDGEYSNIEGVAMIDKNNEIDITKVKKMLKNREDYKRQKEYRSIITTKEEKEEPISEDFKEEDNKTYDIMDVLKEAKESNDEDKRYLSLDNTNYNILKQLKIDKENKENPKNEEDELKELINTITNTSMLNKLGDEELSLKLLEDLQGETKAIQEKDNTEKLDSSFYTSSMKLNSEDFEDSYDPKKPKVIKIAVLVLLAIITIVLIVLFVTKII